MSIVYHHNEYRNLIFENKHHTVEILRSSRSSNLVHLYGTISICLLVMAQYLLISLDDKNKTPFSSMTTFCTARNFRVCASICATARLKQLYLCCEKHKPTISGVDTLFPFDSLKSRHSFDSIHRSRQAVSIRRK